MLKNIEHNIFECANSVVFIYGKNKNAFDGYHDLLNQIIHTTDKNCLILIILGPTAKVLAYDLFKLGYWAIDIGHLPKDYDAYMKGKAKNAQELADFFAPD